MPARKNALRLRRLANLTQRSGYVEMLPFILLPWIVLLKPLMPLQLDGMVHRNIHRVST